MNELLLTPVQVAAIKRVAPAVVATAKMEQVQDLMTQDLIYKLTAEVYRRQLLEESHTIPFETEVRCSPPLGWMTGTVATTAAAFVGLASIFGWWLGFFAVAIALLAVPWNYTAKVRGSVKVDTTLYDQFPEATVYPEYFGKPIRVLEQDDVHPYLTQTTERTA